MPAHLVHMKVENVTHAYCGAKDPGPAHVKHALLFFLKRFIISSHFSIWSCLVNDETFSLSHFIEDILVVVLVPPPPPPGTTKLLLFIFLVFFLFFFFKTQNSSAQNNHKRERTRESKSSCPLKTISNPKLILFWARQNLNFSQLFWNEEAHFEQQQQQQQQQHLGQRERDDI